MNCPYCGAEVADGRALCPVCGGSFNAPPEKDDVRRAKPRKQVNKKKRALVCVLGVIALALAAVVAFTVVRRVQIPDYVAYVESLLPTGDGDYWQDRARLETLHDRHIGFLDRLLMSARERRAADFAARAAEIDEALYAQHLEAKKNAELLVKDKNAALDRMTALAGTPYDTVADLRQLTADADGAGEAFYDEVKAYGEAAAAVFDGENSVWALVIGQDVGDVLADYADDTPFDALSETDRNRIRLLLELYVAEIGVRRNADDTAAMDRLTVLLYAHSAGPYAVGLRREFRSSVDQDEIATDQTAEASAVSESASAPAAENPYEEREYLGFFNEKLVPLLEDQATVFPGFYGYVCALPPTGASLGEVNWSNLMTFYTGEWTGKDYSDSYYRENDDLYRSGPHLSDADFLTAADLEKAHEIEAYTDLYSGSLYSGNLWITMKEPDRLQAAADALFGPGRVDVRDMIDPAIGKPRGFVSENGYLLYLSIDGIDGDMLYPDAFFDVRNVEMTAEGAVLTVRALHFVTTPFDGSYEFFGFPYPSHADYDTYQKMRLDEGMLTESETERLRESDFDEIVRATGFDPAKATTLLVTLRAAENGIVLEDLRVADPAELPETQPSTAAPEPSTEPSSAPVPQNTDAARNDAYRAFIESSEYGLCRFALLADVTRDHEPELIVLFDTDYDEGNGYLHGQVVTCRDGEAVLLEDITCYEGAIRNTFIWYLYEISPGSYDLFYETNGVATGGARACDYCLYYLDQQGERVVEKEEYGSQIGYVSEDPDTLQDNGYLEVNENSLELRREAYRLYCFRDPNPGWEEIGKDIPSSLRFPLE